MSFFPVLLLAGLSQLPAPIAPLVTDDPTIPSGAQAVATAQGVGVQIYECATQSTGWDWRLRAPEAKLLDPATHKQEGMHGAGPSWTWNDGSSILGRVERTRPSPEAGSIAWLLVAAHAGGAGSGLLATVVWVRRSDTHGGVAPAGGCDAAHAAVLVRVPYQATYTFYAAAPR